ncbi:hypothetical protein pb186bvf_000884 [Paramecium bursaria]
MKQTQREPKRRKGKIKKIQEIALDVLHKRSNTLRLTMKNQQFNSNLDQMTSSYQNIVADFPNHSPKITYSNLQILIRGTRSWEGYSNNKENRRRFNIKGNEACNSNYLIIIEDANIIIPESQKYMPMDPQLLQLAGLMAGVNINQPTINLQDGVFDYGGRIDNNFYWWELTDSRAPINVMISETPNLIDTLVHLYGQHIHETGLRILIEICKSTIQKGKLLKRFVKYTVKYTKFTKEVKIIQIIKGDHLRMISINLICYL